MIGSTLIRKVLQRKKMQAKALVKKTRLIRKLDRAIDFKGHQSMHRLRTKEYLLVGKPGNLIALTKQSLYVFSFPMQYTIELNGQCVFSARFNDAHNWEVRVLRRKDEWLSWLLEMLDEIIKEACEEIERKHKEELMDKLSNFD